MKFKLYELRIIQEILFGALRYAGSFLFSFMRKKKKETEPKKKENARVTELCATSCLSSFMAQCAIGAADKCSEAAVTTT